MPKASGGPVELWCPWCESVGPHARRRVHDDGTEFACGGCGRTHTRGDADPDAAFLFFPGDIYAAQGGEPPPL